MNIKLSTEAKGKLDLLQKNYLDEYSNIIVTDAKENNPFKEGDIIQDHAHIGKILKFKVIINKQFNTYNIHYTCWRLKKDLQPFKTGEKISIYLSNVIYSGEEILHTKKEDAYEND